MKRVIPPIACAEGKTLHTPATINCVSAMCGIASAVIGDPVAALKHLLVRLNGVTSYPDVTTREAVFRSTMPMNKALGGIRPWANRGEVQCQIMIFHQSK